MFGNNRPPVSPAFLEYPKREQGSTEALEEFKGALITAYERALEEGVCSNIALATMLDLVSAELKRRIHFRG